MLSWRQLRRRGLPLGRGRLSLHAYNKVGGVFTAPLARCDCCSARGVVKCERCKGAGLENAWLWKKAEDGRPVLP